jgi:hypothetical protein
VDVTPPHLADPGAGFGVSWADYDEDGDPDLLLTSGSGPNRLYRNDAGMFIDITSPGVGGEGGSYGASWGDADNDGDLDLYLSIGIGPDRLLESQGSDVFSKITGGPLGDEGPGQNAAWCDYDNDGDLDLYTTFWEVPNRLLRNDGGANFVDVTPPILAVSGKSTGIAWGDYDNDGDSDLYLGRNVGGKLFRNDGSGGFEDMTRPPFDKVAITGVAWGDYDNDGDLDLYLGREALSNRLLRNDSGSSQDSLIFTDEFIPAVRDTGRTQGVVFFDYDNDGDLDLAGVNTGFLNNSGFMNRLMRNDTWSTIAPGRNRGGSSRDRLPGHALSPETHDSWSEVTGGPLLDEDRSRGAAVADYDGDGDLDLCIANWFSPDQLLRNDSVNGNHWLHVVLDGDGPNRAGIGARVRVVAGGQAQIREISGGSGIFSQNEPVAAFGLGEMTLVDTMEVRWPGGATCTLTDISPVDRVLVVSTDCQGAIGVPGDEPVRLPLLSSSYPNPMRRSTTLFYELTSASPVILEIYDLGGHRVRTFEDGAVKPAGRYRTIWDGRGDGGERVPAGIYFFRLRAGDRTASRKVVLVR